MLDQIEITLRGTNDTYHNIWIDVVDNNLSRKWLDSLNHLISNDYHLEKNYCWLGFTKHKRDAEYICDQINLSIDTINQANLGYKINDNFTVSNTITTGQVGDFLPGGRLIQEKFNRLHRYFEDLQGVSGSLSHYYLAADTKTRWHIRQLNLLCHEYENLAVSLRKEQYIPMWVRPSQLMCWLNAPRFELEEADYELFGIDTINRSLGGVYVGVNKAVGKHHWEVFCDEGRDSRISELVTTTLRSQTEAAGDFDIEWANDPGAYPWQATHLAKFRKWLLANGFDPDDKSLTIGHPKVGQVDLERSFGTTAYAEIWSQLSSKLDVYKIRTSSAEAIYEYNWSDADYAEQQQRYLK